MDPDAIKRCLPGCKQFEAVGPQEWEATMSVGIAAIPGTYGGRVRISDQEPETRYKLGVTGSGAGNRIRGEGVITLEELAGGKTRVSYEGDAQVQGPLAAVGQRLLPPAAKLLGDQFFACMGAQAVNAAQETQETQEAQETPQAQRAGQPSV